MTVQYYVLCAPVVLDANNNDIVVSEDGGIDTTISLGTGTFYLYGDGTEADDLCTVIQDALNNEPSFSNNYDVRFFGNIDSTARSGVVYVSTDGVSLTIKAADPSNTFNWNQIGYSNVSTIGPFSFAENTLTPSLTWLADGPPELVDGDRVEGKAAQHRAPTGGARHTFVVEDPVLYRRLRFNFTGQLRCWSDDDTLNGGLGFNAWQYHWEMHYRAGKTLRLYADTISSGTFLNTLTSADLVGGGSYVLSEPLGAWQPERDTGVPTWAWEIELAEVP